MIYIQQLLDHTYWANQRTLSSLQPEGIPQEAINLFAHLLTTEQIYHERLNGIDPWPQEFWPNLSLTECSNLLVTNRKLYQAFLIKHSAEELNERVHYRNSSGTVYQTPIIEMLLHLALHGEHHRGQIARIVRKSNNEPAVTDLITFNRVNDKL